MTINNFYYFNIFDLIKFCCYDVLWIYGVNDLGIFCELRSARSFLLYNNNKFFLSVIFPFTISETLTVWYLLLLNQLLFHFEWYSSRLEEAINNNKKSWT